MKIRQYVVELISRSGSEPQKVPSTRKLAQMFGVSHPTALKVLQDLAESGHLLAGRNSGYITIPGSFGDFGELKIIGQITGSGNNTFFGLWNICTSIPFLQEILGRSGCFVTQNLYLQGNAKKAADIIRNYNLTGIVWFSPDIKYTETIRELRESGLPIVEVGFTTGSASSARWNFEEDHYRIMNRIFSEGCRHPLILSSSCWEKLYADIQSGIRRSCEEHHFPMERCLFINDSPESSIQQVKQLLNYGLTFDAVLLTGNAWRYWSFLRENFDVKNKCRVFAGEQSLSSDMKFSGIVVTRNMREPARILADNFMQQMESPADAPVITTDIGVDFVLYEDGHPVHLQ